MQQKQQQLTNQQLANQRLQQQQQQQQQQQNSKSSLPATSLLVAKSSSKLLEETGMNAAIGREADEPKTDEDPAQQPINHASIINTSMVHTSMINNSCALSPVTAKADPQPASVTSPAAIDSGSLLDLNKIEEMKVNDLKQELKRCNLPISGSKTTLIERLKNHHLLSGKSPGSGESLEVLKMEVDSPAPKLTTTTSSPSTYTGTQTNHLTSSSVTTFATLTTAAEQATSTGNLLGATAFLTSAQSPALLNGLKPPSHLLKAQTSLSSPKQSVDPLKSPKPVQRRISEPQLQHIQLHFQHFTNPPFLVSYDFSFKAVRP